MPSFFKIILCAGAIFVQFSSVSAHDRKQQRPGHGHKHGHKGSKWASHILSRPAQVVTPSPIVISTTLSTRVAPPSSSPARSTAVAPSITAPTPKTAIVASPTKISPATTSVVTPSNKPVGTYWKPKAGASWQIELSGSSYASDRVSTAEVIDIDLFDVSASTITNLHGLGKKVICYFSAGSFEDWRPDAGLFKTSDYGKGLDGWNGEWWLNTKSGNVRSIMTARIELAKTKGCDGVDPDNVDGYINDTGLDLTKADAVDYMAFMAKQAHSRGMAIGLKNGGDMVAETLPIVDWEVNEQCLEYNECSDLKPFIDAGKPVFHIEYLDDAPAISASTKATKCGDASTKGFSTLLKKMNLDAWVEVC